MSKLSEFIGQQWHDIKGNAKWDFIKWSFWGCFMIPAAISAILKFICDEPLWIILITFIVILVLLLIVWVILMWLIFGNKKVPEKELFEPVSDLEIEGVSCDMQSKAMHTCQIRVHNHSPSKSADDMQVELLAMKEDEEKNKAFFKVEFPWILLPENHLGAIFINPGGDKEFTLFDAGQQESHTPTTIDDIYERVEAEKKGIKYTPPPSSFVIHSYVMCQFKHRNQKKYAFFEKNTDYRLKIKVTARDFPPTESEFDLNFKGTGQQCRFTLTSNQALAIHSAIYGIEGKTFDVTEIVRAHISDGKLNLQCGNGVFGDPRPGRGKTTTIEYSFRGQRSQIRVAEDEITRLP